MAFQKNFVVKNGLEVNDNLIFADKTKNTVGIGTTITPEKVQVNGGIGATSLVLTGVGTIPTLKSSNALVSNLYGVSGVVTSITGTELTYTTGNFGIVNTSNVNAVSGVVTNLSGTISTFSNTYTSILNSGTVLTPNLYAVSGVVTTIAGTGLTFTTGNLSTVNVSRLNAVSGVVTSITGTASTYTTSKSTTNLTTNLYAVSGVVTSISGTASTYTTSKSTTNLTTNLYAVSGVVTSITGTAATYTNLYSTTSNLGTVLTSNLYAVSGVVTSITGTAATYTTGNFGIVNTSNINAVSGVVTSITGTAATYTNLYSTTSNLGTVLTSNLYAVSGVVTSISGSSLSYTNITGSGLNVTGISTFSTAGIGTLSVTGIATIGNVTIRPSVGGGATVGSYTGIVTYYGDASGLINIPAGSPAGSTGQVQYNNGGFFAGSSNFTFDGSNVVVGSGVTINSTGIILSGVATATGFAGTYRGSLAVFSGNSTDNIVRITQAGAGNALVVEDTANPDTTPFVVTGIGSVGIGTNAPINTLDVHGTLRLGRQDSSLDGGEMVFARSSDNTNAWALDVYGSGSNPSFRIVDVTQSSTRIHIGSGGNVGLGSTATSKLHVFGDAIVTGVITSTSAIVGSAVTITSGGVLTVGVVTATDFNSTSDINLKENVATVDNALNIVNDLRGVKFEWKKDHKPSYGVIAQELEQVLPELVTNTNPKTVNYNGIIGVLIEAVKELSAEVEDLKNKL